MKSNNISFINMIVKNLLKINNLTRKTVQEYDYLIELMNSNISPILSREFLLEKYIEFFIEEKQKLESDKEYYDKQYAESKDFIDKYVKEADNKNKIILYMASLHATTSELYLYRSMYNIQDPLVQVHDINPYIGELEKYVESVKKQ